ncbi:MAG: hypothetical protein ABI175_26050 [Polyangiales bacterium]
MKRAAILLGLVACGDDVRRDPPAAPVSGTRLKLEWYFYGDGSREPNPDAFYDTLIHGRCTPRLWSDGEERCAPEADQAVYTNAACTELVGRADVITKPAFFLGFDQIDGERLPARLYYAGPVTTAPASIYERIDGQCAGPRFTPSDAMYFELNGETQAAGVVALRDRDVTADDRLDMQLRETDDGLYLPLGLRDRTLDVACRAAERPGGAVCEPTFASGAFYFADPDCSVPALGIPLSQPAPAIATATDGDGCTAYHAVGEGLPVLYARNGASCQPVPTGAQLRGYALAAPIALAPIERTVVVDRAHRLQQIVIAAGTERLLDDRLYDTATRLDCRRAEFDDAVRCIPAATIQATSLFAPGCTLQVPVAELPERTCTPIGFATTFSDDGVLQLRAIGDRPTTPLYSLFTGNCAPYVPPAGRVVRTVGPPIPTETFVGGHAAGER